MFKKIFRCIGFALLGLASFVSTQSIFAMAPEPEVIYGTWQTGDKTQECVVCALESGIRCIDTARMYGNEKQVGLAVNEFISSGGSTREEIKIITKLLPADVERYAVCNNTDIRTATRLFFYESLNELEVRYVDVVLIHDVGRNPETIRAIYEVLLDLKSKGHLIKQVGVSNFLISDVKMLKPKPDVVQNPFFPGILCQEILETFCVPGRNTYEYCREENILYQGYKSLGHGKLVGRDGITVYDCLKYALQHGVSPVFSSTNVDHIRQVGEAVQTRRLNESSLSEAGIDELNLSGEELGCIIYAQ